MAILLDIVLGIIVIDIMFLALFTISYWYYKIKARRLAKADGNTTQVTEPVAEPELSSEPDTSISTYLLAIEKYGASIIRLGEDGWVTAQTLLGDAETTADAEALALRAGWRTEGAWETDSEVNTIVVVPNLIAVSFVASSEIDPEKALYMARLAGMDEVVSVVKQDIIADEGKVVVYFSSGIPHGWVDSEIVAWA